MTQTHPQMPSAPSAATPREGHSSSSAGSARAGSARRLSFLAPVVVLALAGAGTLGLWIHKEPAGSPADVDAPSFGTLAERALTGARDVGAFVRDSAARDLSTLTDLWQRDEPDETSADAGPGLPRERAHSVPSGRSATYGGVGGPLESTAHVTRPGLATSRSSPEATASVGPLTQAVFDSRAVEVTPPLLDRVRLRRASPRVGSVERDSGESGLVEVVVSASGAVESAKFLTRPLNVHESMLLSAVKAWRFRPAMRNGHAIRYRLTVPISRVRI